MTVSSMTGFARAAGQDDDHGWTWEARSVNGKGRDVRCRLPAGLDELEGDVRSAAARHLARGSVSLTLALRRAPGKMDVTVNEDLLDQIEAIAGGIARRMTVEPPRLDGLLSVRGVLDVREPEEDKSERTALKAVMLRTLDDVLGQLVEARKDEGARTHKILDDHISGLDGLVGSARHTAAAQPDALRVRLKEQISELLDSIPALNEERITQEAALLIAKADVREELDRLSAHVAAARELLDQVGPVGRKLDFLSQEFNREANTLCSKSSDLELTRIGLEMKAVIDRFREQVANVE
jgi:uncharacterized protein (TIGR00255 family)